MPSFHPNFHFLLRSMSGACALLSLTFLGGCEDDTTVSAFAPACPRFEIPGSIADRFIYDGKGIDVSHLVSHTQITSVNGDCSNGPQDSHKRPLTRVRLSLTVQQDRGPAASKADEDIPYFVAIIHDGSIVDKKLFHDTIHTPLSRATQKTNTPLRFIDIPTGDNPQVSPYTLDVGFQLSHEELDYNRKHLARPAAFEQHIQ